MISAWDGKNHRRLTSQSLSEAEKESKVLNSKVKIPLLRGFDDAPNHSASQNFGPSDPIASIILCCPFIPSWLGQRDWKSLLNHHETCLTAS